METHDSIGPFRVLDVLGEGGMGTVYLAEQKQPVRRRVALKVIKLGMDSKVVLARFEAERQALAMMEHDSIARVFEAGTTETGQPYFAMELVKGVPLTEYCDTNKLGLRARLELFLSVCSAVQHAHHKGIIHRDLTPRNIMVTTQDGVAVPKVIDFGLARATDHRLTENTLYTEVGTIVGTLEYMSPEQAGLSGLDVDTRTDVYSLGMILYELLVGELPFSSSDLRHAGLLEAQRVIREVDPPRPSTKLTSLGVEPSGERARLRGLDVWALRRRLTGDLDWIVMKALEKDRTRRYGTAEALGNDVRRHLDEQPVLARPASAGYRAAKFVRRHKVRVALASALVLSLIGGFIASAQFALELSETLDSTRALGLAKAAQDEIRSDPTRAMLLALEAMAVERAPETRSALHRSLALNRERKVFDNGAHIGFADVAHDGRRFVTGDRVGRVTAWSLDRGKMWQNELDETAPEVGNDVLFLGFLGKRCDRVVACNSRGEVFLLDAETGHTLDRHRSRGKRMNFGSTSPQRSHFLIGFAADSPRGFAQLYRLEESDRDAITLVGGELAHTAPVLNLAFAPARAGGGVTTFATGASPGRVQLWTVGPRGPLSLATDLLPRRGPIQSLEFSADGRSLLIGAQMQALYDLDSAKLQPLSGRGWTDFVKADRGPPRRVMIGGVDLQSGTPMVARIVDSGDEPVGELRFSAPIANTNRPDTPAVSPDRRMVGVGMQDGGITLFDWDGYPRPILRGHSAGVLGLRFVQGPRHLVSWGYDGTLRFWDLEDDRFIWRPGRRVKIVRQAPNGSVLTVHDAVDSFGKVRSLAQLRNEKGELVFSASTNGSAGLPRHAFSTDYAHAAINFGGVLKVYDTRTGEQVGMPGPLSVDTWASCWLPHTDEILCIGPKIRGIQSCGEVIDWRNGRISEGPKPWVPNVRALASAPDGRSVVIVSGETAEIHRRVGDRWESGQRLAAPLARHASFSRDGEHVYIGSNDGSIRVFDADGTPAWRLRGHRQTIRAIVFSPDGSLVATASEDATVRLWTTTGELVAVLEGPSGPVIDCSFTPDGEQLWTAHREDGTVRKWILDDDQLMRAARERASRQLTSDERVRFAKWLRK